MPPKKSGISKSRKAKGSSSASTQQFHTPNDYLEAADDFESAMRKWRAGDADKALRFYQRALMAYEEGLNKFPNDFDLAYNKANLQYNIATDARLLKHIIATRSGDEVELLEQSLDAHRYTLQLNQSNAEILFNTATVLTALAENLSDSDDLERKSTAVKFLREAVELFDSCLTRQEFDLDEFQSIQEEAVAEQSEDYEIEENAKVDGSPELAEVIEPTTPNTLVETALSALSAITSLISLVSAETAGKHNISSTIASLSELGSSILRAKLPAYMELLSNMTDQGIPNDPPVSVRVLSIATSKVSMETSEPKVTPLHKTRSEIALATVLFQSSLADAEYKNQLTNFQTYFQRLENVFKENSDPSNVKFLFAQANAFDDLAAAILTSDSDVNQPDALSVAWKAIKVADETISKVEELMKSEKSYKDGEPHISEVLVLHGDIALRLSRLFGLPGVLPDLGRADAISTARLQAGEYYGLADKEASAAGDQDDNAVEARIKGMAVEANGSLIDSIHGIDHAKVQATLQDMVEEGLIDGNF